MISLLVPVFWFLGRLAPIRIKPPGTSPIALAYCLPTLGFVKALRTRAHLRIAVNPLLSSNPSWAVPKSPAAIKVREQGAIGLRGRSGNLGPRNACYLLRVYHPSLVACIRPPSRWITTPSGVASESCFSSKPGNTKTSTPGTLCLRCLSRLPRGRAERYRQI